MLLVPRDLELPVLTLDRSAVRANLAAMAAFCADAGVLLAPHSKTTLSPALVRAQLSAGAWGSTASSVGQVRGLLAAGVQRVLLANELVDPVGVGWVDETFLGDEPPAELWTFVDSADAVDALDTRLRGPRRLPVLVEVGYPGGRAGVRTAEEALAVADRVAGSRHLRLAGVAGFEGLLPAPGGALPPGLGPYLDAVVQTTTALAERGHWRQGPPPIVTAGGSSYFDVVAHRLGPSAFGFPVRTVLRSGCYVTHDHGIYERTSPSGRRVGDVAPPVLVPALELLAHVLSTPEPGSAIAGFGRRHVPIDDTLPRVLWRERDGVRTAVHGTEVVAVNDQHAYLRPAADEPLRVGDVVGLGISHPCGAFDRWRRIVVVDGEHRVVGTVSTDLDAGDPRLADGAGTPFG